MSQQRPRKSSACVTLVLIGAAALAGCGSDAPPGRRASYPSKEACLADWGDPKECEEQGPVGSRSYGPSTGTWHSYSSRSGSSSSRSSSSSSSSSGSHSISRGGFGSHGSSAS